MREKLLTKGDNSINIPVNIKTIITYAENDNNINIDQRNQSDVKTAYAKVTAASASHKPYP